MASSTLHFPSIISKSQKSIYLSICASVIAFYNLAFLFFSLAKTRLLHAWANPCVRSTREGWSFIFKFINKGGTVC